MKTFSSIRFCAPMSRAGLFAAAVAIVTATVVSSHQARAAAEPATAPAPVHESFHDLDVHVVGTGRPVLMIPGLDSAGGVWTETCAALQPGVQCHIVQLPGFAGLPPVADARFLDAMRDRLLDYVDAHGLRSPDVIGHSLGGELALMMAEKAPERVGRLVIVDALPDLGAIMLAGAEGDAAKARAAMFRDQMRNASADESAASLRAMAAGMTHGDAHVERIVEWGRASDRPTAAEAYYELLTTDLRPGLPRIAHPVLVLGSWAAYAPTGATLDSTRRIFETQYAGLKGAEVRMSEHGYHFLMWDDADWMLAQVRPFLALN
jgi:pimeloyl-ACP methyl ester carboxylesterase